MFGKNKSAPYGIEQATAELDAIIEKASEAFVLRRSTNRSVKHAFEPVSSNRSLRCGETEF